jgi:hypothetical protein
MGIGFLHGTSVFKSIRVVVSFLFLVLAAACSSSRVYAAPWFSTYGAGVLSGSLSTDSIKGIQPDFDPADMFKSTLVQPGTVSPTLIYPDNNYDFSYGAILTSGDHEVFKSDGTTHTIDAYATGIGAIGSFFPLYQRLLDIAADVSSVCPGACNKILTTCNIPPGIYKASINCINNALDSLSGLTYNISSNGLVVLIEDPGAAAVLQIKNELKSSNPSKRIAVITANPIRIQTIVGNSNVTTQAGYLLQEADIQAMLISTFAGTPSIEVEPPGPNRLKLEGPIIAKGGVSFRRDADVGVIKWPGVLVRFNPFYTAELAKLDKSLSIFGSSFVRWSYE